jgi:hypothetical protein
MFDDMQVLKGQRHFRPPAVMRQAVREGRQLVRNAICKVSIMPQKEGSICSLHGWGLGFTKLQHNNASVKAKNSNLFSTTTYFIFLDGRIKSWISTCQFDSYTLK